MRTTLNSRSTSAPESAAVGSSMIRTRASKDSAFGDLDDLLIGDREAAHRPLGIQPDAEAVEQFLDPRVHRPAVDALERAERVIAHDDVLRDAEIREQRRLLVDHREARVARVVRGVEVDRLAVDEHVAASRRTTPPSTLTSVDLPAPFSPISARTSPACSVRSPSRSARTAP